MLNTLNTCMNWGNIINNDALCEDAAVEAAKLLDSTTFLSALDDESLDSMQQAPNVLSLVLFHVVGHLVLPTGSSQNRPPVEHVTMKIQVESKPKIWQNDRILTENERHTRSNRYRKLKVLKDRIFPQTWVKPDTNFPFYSHLVDFLLTSGVARDFS